MENITKVSFENYKCFKNSVVLDNLKPINVIIGKNNIGKSSILDIIEMMYDPDIKWKNYNTNIYVSKFVSKKRIVEVFGRENELVDKEFKFKIDAEKLGYSDKCRFKRNPVGNMDEIRTLSCKYSSEWDKFERNLHFNDELKVKRIYAERNISPEEDKNSFDMNGYGMGTTNAINAYLNKSKYNENIIKIQLLSKLNEIMGEDAKFEEITTQQVEIDGKIKWEIFLKEKGKDRVALSKSGSGLKTILLVLIYTILVPEIEHKDKLENYIFLFEELENNLHPSLERRLLKYLEEVANNGATIFLTTHSSTMLDGFQNKENVQLYHVIKENDEVIIKGLDDFYGKSGCIDDLGIKASDILQSNGIIWVEEPSDRIYINKWIELWSDGILKEGMDYQCVFYGGRLLSNITFDPNEIDELIKVVNINKNSIILIDSDITKEGKRINQTKARIRKEVELNNNVCWITKGKEIENYIPQKILEKKYNKKFKQEFNRYDKINEYLNKEVGELAGDKFFRSKVEFAKSVTKLMTKNNMKDFLDLDQNMKKVIATIKLWNEK